MRKVLLFISALMMLFAWGNKTAKGGDNDSTAVSDTLNMEKSCTRALVSPLNFMSTGIRSI